MLDTVLKVAAAVTQLATAISAVAAVVLLFIKGPQELRKARRLKLAEKKAEVAASALVASIDLLQGMDAASIPVNLRGDPKMEAGQAYVDFMRTWFGARMQRIQPQLDALGRIRMQAHVYLTDAQNEALDAVSKHVNYVIGEFMTWATFTSSDGLHEQAGDAFLHVFGSEPTKAREALKKNVTEALRDSAQYKDVT